MKPFVRIIVPFLLICIIFQGCSEDDAFDVANAVSDICNNVTGAEAIHWDLENGIPRTDLPGGIPPNVDVIGGVYSHPVYPLLGFNYPPGWTPETINTSSAEGVNLIRNDNKAVWRWGGYFVQSGVTALQVRDFEVSSLLEFFNLGTAFETVCVNSSNTTVAVGINISTSNILLRAGGSTALVASSITYGSSILTPKANVKVAVAPTTEFPTRVFDTFLAIEFQLLIGNSGTDDDRDNDGTPDVYDNFPDDPTRS
ncbi:MAG: hypothetical protein GY751_19275 [Bacteroidetes bacterium]|nr:hypothetical protein [Bacteroidota bacterium]